MGYGGVWRAIRIVNFTENERKKVARLVLRNGWATETPPLKKGDIISVVLSSQQQLKEEVDTLTVRQAVKSDFRSFDSDTGEQNEY